MHYYEVAPTQIVRSGTDTFTYSSEVPLAVGQVVRVSVGKKLMNGLVLGVVDSAPAYATKPIESVLESVPIPLAHIKLARWLAEYYATPLASVLQTLLPTGMHKNRREKPIKISVNARKRTNYVLNKDQASAVQTIADSGAGTVLLHGITGSGKTAIYIELAQRTIAAGKSAIILVPEIALTSQLVSEFAHHFNSIILAHSKQTEAERHAAWRTALHATSPHVVIGPRSALFMPLANIGLIIVDESHEPSYKQEQSPRYHALRAAHQLAAASNAPVVLGSATPSITDYFLAQSTGRPIITLDKLAVPQAYKPTVRLVDMTKRTHFKRHRFLSDAVLNQIEQDSTLGKQVLLFHNRRGSAPTTLCENCGWQAGCPRCYVPLTLHADTHQLRCHICNFTSQVPTSCPECSHTSIIHKGIGTKLIESEVRRLFPKLNIARFDGDTSSEDTVEARYKDLYDGTIDIIIGTQVIAKGLDLPNLHTVAVVQADAGLSLPDYTSPERTFQLLAQVVGRVGRQAHETNVIVQSYQPTHPAITLGLAQDYAQFYESAIKLRKRSSFPPFRYLLKLQCSYKTEAAAIRNAKAFAEHLKKTLPPDVQLLGPTPAFYERAGGQYRWQLVLKSPKRAHLTNALFQLPPKNWQFELDPISLL
ncbi:primosomal protein N' [Candidatus Saccharibacteria bacterium]|nr:primosomal protein N' [Candidatus Saccharibacteria bacterium]